MELNPGGVFGKIHLSVFPAVGRGWEKGHGGKRQLVPSFSLPQPYHLAPGYDGAGLEDLDGVEGRAEIALAEGRLELSAGVL